MARVDVIMPQMGESIAEGTIAKWLKKPGDAVKRDEPILEISTDKVDAEIPAPASGVLTEVKVGEGKTVPVQTVIGVIETEAGAVRAEGAGRAEEAGGSKAPSAAAPAAARPAAAPPARSAPSAPPASPAPSAGGAGRGGDGVQTQEERLRQRSTPLVRKIAAEHQVDIGPVPGTGIAGRVTKKDILSFIESGAAAPAAPSAPSAGAVGGGGAAVVHPTVEAWPGDRVEP